MAARHRPAANHERHSSDMANLEGLCHRMEFAASGTTRNASQWASLGSGEIPSFLASSPGTKGRVLTVASLDLPAFFEEKFQSETMWLVDGSGTARSKGPIQAGAALWSEGWARELHSAAFMPVSPMRGSWKKEAGETVMEIGSSAAEELALAWALEEVIQGNPIAASAVVVDNLQWVASLCGLEDPSPTTHYSRSILAEAIAGHKSVMFIARKSIPGLAKEYWSGRKKAGKLWPPDAAACAAQISHGLLKNASCQLESDIWQAYGEHGDIHPRAWGSRMDIVRLVHEAPGVARECGCSGGLMAVIVELIDPVGHRGPWLTGHPISDLDQMTVSRLHSGNIISRYECDEMKRLFPMRVADTAHTRRNPPEDASAFFYEYFNPEEAHYTRLRRTGVGVSSTARSRSSTDIA
jgi:hypothetical protein